MLRIIAVLTILAALAAIALLQLRSPAAPDFTEIARLTVEGNAEIIQVSPDGMLLVHTNADHQSIGIVDLSEPTAPAPLASIDMPGEPTSVGISPNGQWALAAVYPESADEDPRLPGVLAVIDLRDPANPTLASTIGIANHPDSIAVTANGDELIAVIAIENEHQKEALGAAGAVQIVRVDPATPRNWSVTTLELTEELLRDAGMLFASSPQPEFVALSPGRKMAAVSLQENNGVILIDLSAPAITGAFNLGSVSDRPADLLDDGEIIFTQSYPSDADQKLAGTRFPDGISFTPSGQHLISADEGEMSQTGGRGISIWSLNGDLIWDDGGEIEQQAVAAGYYPDDRSAERGIEVEGVTTGRFDSRDFAFAVSERGSFMAVYDINNPSQPVFVQLLPTGAEPESVIAIPARNLIAVAAEESGEITIYRYEPTEPRGNWLDRFRKTPAKQAE